MHTHKYALKHVHTHDSDNICRACGPIFKGKVRADNDLKPFLQSIGHEKYMALPRDEGRKEARTQDRKLSATGL